MKHTISLDIPVSFVDICKELKMPVTFVFQTYLNSVSVAEVLLAPSFRHSAYQQQIITQYISPNRLASLAFSDIMKPINPKHWEKFIEAQKQHIAPAGKILLIHLIANDEKVKRSRYNRVINLWHKKITASKLT